MLKQNHYETSNEGEPPQIHIPIVRVSKEMWLRPIFVLLAIDTVTL